VWLKTSTNRDVVETVAMSRIIPWLRENTRPFEYTTSVAVAAGLDIVVVSRECAEMCKRKDIRPSALARGSNWHDMQRPNLTRARSKADNAWAQSWGGDPPPVILPIAHMRKAELWNALPEPLRELTWSCRRPIFNGDQVTACGDCHTCREIAEEGVPLNAVAM